MEPFMLVCAQGNFPVKLQQHKVRNEIISQCPASFPYSKMKEESGNEAIDYYQLQHI